MTLTNFQEEHFVEIICIEVIEHVSQYETFVKNISKVI